MLIQSLIICRSSPYLNDMKMWSTCEMLHLGQSVGYTVLSLALCPFNTLFDCPTKHNTNAKGSDMWLRASVGKHEALIFRKRLIGSLAYLISHFSVSAIQSHQTFSQCDEDEPRPYVRLQHMHTIHTWELKSGQSKDSIHLRIVHSFTIPRWHDVAENGVSITT